MGVCSLLCMCSTHSISMVSKVTEAMKVEFDPANQFNASENEKIARWPCGTKISKKHLKQ